MTQTQPQLLTRPAGTAPPAVALSGLTKRFGAVTAVDGLDLIVQPGEVVAFLGPNGAGKTSTIDMMLGLSRPDAGTVLKVGVDRGDQEIKDTDVYLMDQLLREGRSPSGVKYPLFPP